MKILGLEIPNGVYQSARYCMYVDKPNKELQKELNKTYYIENKTKRLKKVRELLKNNNDFKLNTHVSKSKTINWENYGFESLEEFIKLKNQNMFFGNWVEVSNKRALEIEVYILGLYDNASKIFGKNKSSFDTICFLIDEQFKEHKDVFDDPKSDIIYRTQYNHLIYDLLQKKINEFVNIPIDDIRETLITKKPLVWNAKKSSIGTLFGMLHNAKIIDGSKTDMIRGLTAMFDNLVESSVKDNVNLKVYTAENKCYYDEETENNANSWVEYLKTSTTK
ncbi:hypothetical protein LG651_02655 [Tamlana sp. 62-3]|uniref:Uncharacterized protein n=1 Tax=Neotamlana sargassicola TaxID=2883125 RepID=A0A9X1I6L2_9FLAO|nr:hypothetical protein [Tamlana sargassicola]MCB4807136.1 hypothetical protein [Tamlana sargassicola]